MPQGYGAAATDAILQVLAEREATKQRELANQHVLFQERLAQQKADAEAKRAEFDQQQAVLDRGYQAEDRKIKAEDRTTAQLDKKRKDLQDRFLPGDILTDQADVDAVKALRLGGATELPRPPQTLMKPNVMVTPQAGAQELPRATPPQLASSVPAAVRFAGSAQQRQQAEQRQRLKNYIIENAGKPQGEAASFAEATGQDVSTIGMFVPKLNDVTAGSFEDFMSASPERQAQIIQRRKAYLQADDRPLQQAGPQPQIFYDKAGNLHAVQFTGGAAREIPMPTDIEGPTKTNPIPASVQSQMIFAKQVGAHVPTIRAEIEQLDKMGALGPVLGRINEFLAGKVGTTEILGHNSTSEADRIINKFRNDLSFLKSGMGKVHFGARGGVQLLQRFDSQLSSGKMTAGELMGGLDSYEEWLKTYGVKPDNFSGVETPETPAGTAKPKVDAAKILQDVLSGKKGGD